MIPIAEGSNTKQISLLPTGDIFTSDVELTNDSEQPSWNLSNSITEIQQSNR